MSDMKGTTMLINVIYHDEPEGMWAESPDVAGFSAAADGLRELRKLVREGLAHFLDSTDLDVRENWDNNTTVVDFNFAALPAAVGSFVPAPAASVPASA